MVGEGRRDLRKYGGRPKTHRDPKSGGGGGGGGNTGKGCAVTALALAGGLTAIMGATGYGLVEALKAVLG